MPVTAGYGVHDTQKQYKSVSVSFGVAWSRTLKDGTIVHFIDNILPSSSRIDERNLVFCIFLNVAHSSITLLDTTYLSNLRVLILFETRIRQLDT